jgi:hypothetical protein
MNDDFDIFIKKRASAFIEEIKIRLVVIPADSIDSTISGISHLVNQNVSHP